MTTLQTASGRLMRVQGPRGLTMATPPGAVWSDGRGHDLDAAEDFAALSYVAIIMTQPNVAAVANKVVRTLASRPLKTYELLPDGDRIRVRGNMNHRGAGLARLIERPLERRSSVHLKQWIAFPAAVFGNSVLAKYRADKQAPPTALFRLNWTQLSGYAETGGDIAWWGSTQMGGVERFVRVEDTIHFAWDAPENGVGISPLQQLAQMIRLENAAVRSQTASFRNGSRMGGFISPPPGVKFDKDAADRMRESIEQLHKGVDRHGRVALLAPGSTFESASFSLVDLELMKARLFNREEACMIYDVKPPAIGDLKDANNAALREISRDFHMTTMPPWYTLVEETLQAQLIDPEPEWEGMFVEFDLSDQLRGDPLQEAESLEKQIFSGQITLNESRKIRNLPRVDHPKADTLWMPINNEAPFDTEPKQAPQQATPTPPPSGKISVIRDAQGNITGYQKG